jgi:hypothetical protein
MLAEIHEAERRDLLRPEEKEEIEQRGSWEEIYKRRERGSTIQYRVANPEEMNGKKSLPIPMVMDIDVSMQHREPTYQHKMVIASVAKRILWTAPPREDGQKPQSVKVYRLTQRILTPYELSTNVSVLAKFKHMPFFLGEFDREGRLKDTKDPFLYWFLPIAKVPDEYPDQGLQVGRGAPVIQVNLQPESGFLLDCVELHAAGRVIDKEKK